MKKHGPFFLPLVSVFLLSSNTWAHPKTDWRLDKKAFASAKDAVEALSEPKALSVLLPPISTDFLKQKLSQFSGAVPTMVDGMQVTISERGSARGRNLALKWLAQEYAALGYQVKTESFSGGANFVAERAGTEGGKYFVLSSHIDSVGNAGANDDGSGTITVLAIAHALKDVRLKHSLRILGFDREEDGLIGSQAYVEGLKNRENFLGNFQFDMVATNGRKDGRFHIIDCDRQDSKPLTTKIMNAAQALRLPLKRVAACTEASDHASFWQEGLASVVISENFFGGDSDPCYHSRCDKLDSRLDFGYMGAITTASAHAAAELLEAY